jgi:hypothetical protein
MGFMDILKGGLSLIPGVGPALSAGASILGKQQEGKAAGAASQAQLQQGQDRNALQLYRDSQAAQDEAARRDLDRQKFGAGEQGRNAKNAIFSALLGGGMPRTSINVPGIQSANVSGGLMDALKNNPDALKSLAMLKGQANTSMESGPTFTGGNMVAAPKLTPLPDMGKGNGFLSAIANIGQIVGGVSPYLKKPTPDGDYGGEYP